MRIAIDGRYLCDAYPGIGRYLFDLLGALPAVLPEAELFVLVDPAGENSRHDLGRLASAGLRLVETRLRPRSLPERLRLRAAFDALAPDLVHTPYYFAPRPRQRHVLTLHDLIPLRQRVPRNPAARLLARRALRATARRADGLLVPTRALAGEIQARLSARSVRVHVTPYGVGASFQPAPAAHVQATRRALDLPERYVLHVGTHAPHKNVAGLVAAWQRSERRDHVLVLAGGGRPAATPAVRTLGRVDESHLPALYTGATLFVLPSLEEGFGLPLLEAMACGVPTACARGPALDEVAGGAAAQFDPRDGPGLAALLSALLRDPDRRAALARDGLARSRTFTWQHTAELTAQAYRETLRASVGAH